MSKVRTLGPGSLKIGKTGTAQDFSADVINTALEPSTDTEDNDNFLDGHTEGGSQTETWALTGKRQGRLQHGRPTRSGVSSTAARRCRSSGCRTLRAA